MDTITEGSLYDRYTIHEKKGEGTFSEVVKCTRKSDGKQCAIKRMKGKFNSVEQVNNLREVQALRRLNPHPCIVDMLEVVYDKKAKTLDIVFELMEMNIYERIKGRRTHLPESLVKHYTYQLLKALDHMHRNGIFHRDIKPENVLVNTDDKVKLADFGSCRGIYSKPPFTEYISTRWYRAPECLLTDGFYGFKMDLWSVGCVMFEVMSLYPLFPGANELDQINKIHDIMGTPDPQLLAKIRKNSPHMKFEFPAKKGSGLAKLLPGASEDCLNLLQGLLDYDPDQRFSAKQALRHPYFKELRDADKRAARAAGEASDTHKAESDTVPVESHRRHKDTEKEEKKEEKKKSHKSKSTRHAGPQLSALEESIESLAELSISPTQELQPLNGKGHVLNRQQKQRKEIKTKAIPRKVGGDAILPPIMYQNPKQQGMVKSTVSLPSIGNSKLP